MSQGFFSSEGVITSEIQIMAFSAKEGVFLLVWCCLAFSCVKGNLFLSLFIFCTFVLFLPRVKLSALQHYGISRLQKATKKNQKVNEYNDFQNLAISSPDFVFHYTFYRSMTLSRKHSFTVVSLQSIQ